MPISIVMPTYNGIKYIEQAIQSVQTQTYQEWELVISDDGSKDGTREFLSKLQDPRISKTRRNAITGQAGAVLPAQYALMMS